MGRPKKKHAGGRPTKFNEEVVRKLEEAFKNDFTDREACLYAGISGETFYSWKEQNRGFSEQMDRAKQFVAFAAKRNIAQAIVKKDSVDDAWKYVKSRQRELYAERSETTGKDGGPIETKTTLDVQTELLQQAIQLWKKRPNS